MYHSLKQLYFVATPVHDGRKGILRSIHTQIVPNIPVKIVFVRDNNKENEWLAIVSTDCRHDIGNCWTDEMEEIKGQYSLPYVVIEVGYTQGILGTNVLAIREQDALIISDLNRL